jgi:hypothetical protein
MENIIDAARVRPIRIQSLFMQIEGAPVPHEEISAFIERLSEIRDAGGAVMGVQVYTVARRPAETYVTPLADQALEAIAARVRKETGLLANAYCAAGAAPP